MIGGSTLKYGPAGTVEIFTEHYLHVTDSTHPNNGDGILFYPGHMPFYPEEDRGMNKVFSSIRLKNIRRGIVTVERYHPDI